ncbi:glycine--tRNA ligase [Candidatus Roizmanbacteria bacterium RIFCSPLOWO2_01_FULL_39_19]|nr:MAG: glycine--tRNA ligase [Candidatus Roizmanbacteria bacterium RIFCSPLOWO2_01_FULL_39_19]
MKSDISLEKIVSLAKRRGFVYPSSDIYGGMANTWDFGHYGVLLKNNIRDLWWKTFVLDRDDMVGIEASIFLNPKVWKASGHTTSFTDALVDCRKCKFRTRADHLIEDNIPNNKVEGLTLEELTKIIIDNKLKCPKCGLSDFTSARNFNLLFETQVGIIEETKSKVYLRGEIAQGIFINFKNVLNTMRVKVPFGIAQIGKAFRNEITMGQFIHRTLEFDLMEFEYFIQKSQWGKIFEKFQTEMWDFAKMVGIDEKKLRWREHEEHERSHYSKKTADIEYEYSFGWKEMFGIAYRTDFDLSNHAKHTGRDLSYTDPKTGEKFIPHVIEPTFGLSRLIGIILFDAYFEEEINGQTRTVLKLAPSIAPVKAAIFPLQKDEKLQKIARELYEKLKKQYVVEFDDSDNIGKMYRRQDEIGTPFCITADYQTLEDNAATVRERDTMKQERMPLEKIETFLHDKII